MTLLNNSQTLWMIYPSPCLFVRQWCCLFVSLSAIACYRFRLILQPQKPQMTATQVEQLSDFIKNISISISFCLSVSQSVCNLNCLSVCWKQLFRFIRQPQKPQMMAKQVENLSHLINNIFISMSVCLSICLSVCLWFKLSVCLLLTTVQVHPAALEASNDGYPGWKTVRLCKKHPSLHLSVCQWDCLFLCQSACCIQLLRFILQPHKPQLILRSFYIFISFYIHIYIT
jgi:hypothetical protein